MTALRVDLGSAELRRAVGPVAWFVLEELLLGDGEEAGDVFIARASARSLATALSLNKDTVARALASLSGAGVVEQVPQSNAGRFASGRYRVALCPGITRLDDASRRDEAPVRPHRPAPAPRHVPAQLTLLDIAHPGDDASTPSALPDPPQPSDALAPSVRGRPGAPSRDGNVSAGIGSGNGDGTTGTTVRPC